MSSQFTRRKLLTGFGGLAAATLAWSRGSTLSPELTSQESAQGKATFPLSKGPFRIAIINDELSQDFGRACEVASREFGMGWIELRGMWNKNIVNLDSKEVVEAQRILQKYNLQVTDIASPLFKVAWEGAPLANSVDQGNFNADFTFRQQDEVLERALEMAQAFHSDRIRCFDFYRIKDQAPYRPAINEKLLDAATKAGKKGVTLVLENDGGLNTETGGEAAKVLAVVKSPYFMLNWDPGNAAASGEIPYPDGYNLLPKERIAHCHCKDAVKRNNKFEWAPMGGGIVDWAGQFKAFKRDAYRFAVSLETHWRGATTPEESSRQSWAGMKKLLQEAGAL